MKYAAYEVWYVNDARCDAMLSADIDANVRLIIVRAFSRKNEEDLDWLAVALRW